MSNQDGAMEGRGGAAQEEAVGQNGKLSADIQLVTPAAVMESVELDEEAAEELIIEDPDVLVRLVGTYQTASTTQTHAHTHTCMHAHRHKRTHMHTHTHYNMSLCQKVLSEDHPFFGHKYLCRFKFSENKPNFIQKGMHQRDMPGCCSWISVQRLTRSSHGSCLTN